MSGVESVKDSLYPLCLAQLAQVDSEEVLQSPDAVLLKFKSDNTKLFVGRTAAMQDDYAFADVEEKLGELKAIVEA